LTTYPPEGSRARAEWARRVLWTSAALLFTAPLVSIFYQPVGWIPVALVVGIALLAAVRPFGAVLVVAGLGPLAIAVFLAVRDGTMALRFEEPVVLAALVGWCVRRAIQPTPLAVHPLVRASASLLMAAALASMVVATARVLTEHPGMPAAAVLVPLLVEDYLVNLGEFSAGLLMVEGALLLLLVADMCAAGPAPRTRVLTLMIAGAAAAALLNLNEVASAALARENSWNAFVNYLRTIRLNVQYGDLNAAGSYFAMMLFPAAGLMMRSRAAAVLAAPLIAAGLWLTGSRIALAATLIAALLGGVVIMHRHNRLRPLPLLGILGLTAAIGVAGWNWYPEGRNLATRAYALKIRIDMGQAGLKLAAEEPVFGIGPGRFRPLADKYAEINENAHNNFIQVLAEYGAIGLVLFVTAVLSSLGSPRSEADRPSAALVCGITAFLLTCVAGHPLLVHAAAYPFWMALGLAAAPATRTRSTSTRPIRVATLAVLALLAGTLPFRAIAARRQADVENASSGFSLWQRGPERSRYRWAGGRSLFFVKASARRVRIPIERGPQAPDPVEVRVFLDGREADRVRLTGDEQRLVRLALMREPEAKFRRIELEAVAPGTATPLSVTPTGDGGALKVWRPLIDE